MLKTDAPLILLHIKLDPVLAQPRPRKTGRKTLVKPFATERWTE